MPTWALYVAALVGVLIAVCGVSVARLYIADAGGDSKAVSGGLLAAAIGLGATLTAAVAIIARML